MSVVQCPHCARHVTNDGSLAGQVVICPGCHRQFQMPQAEEDTPTIKHSIRELIKRRKRMSLRIWFGGRFSWSRDVATEPFVFYLITFTVALFSVGCGLIVIRLFGWRAATGIRFVTPPHRHFFDAPPYSAVNSCQLVPPGTSWHELAPPTS
jgi:hypothetical protein